MEKIFNRFGWFLCDTRGSAVVSPLYDGISTVGPIAISVCLILSIFWGIFLGVKYAKAEDPGEKENLHKILVNFCIGAVAVIVLIAIVYAIRGPLVALIDSE